jgi:hypothetical protein
MQENNCLKLPRRKINTGVEKNDHLNKVQNFDHQMSQSKSKCWCLNNCLQSKSVLFHCIKEAYTIGNDIKSKEHLS